ncbi:restriction modification system DNA specificity domain protein [Methanohalobium evestigatum Z-7303]|uniref:Restriction modification system DNA specificity domain protein n=1 Tax=Methanohalobium evestigatum (strain ATCC BAA-1072 / DSM 3721 / NBRC 107634 / OCM 161 / Z-7303) TaxID=644295 RepID=D7E837_METEZ|nr:restriction endonuclease subunit S [Methanohalobium evestigatum]ADI73379.1 restriction modification system DNA specificity domain protein [Methanohalobium evestigatum Z-7303]
MSGVVQEQRQKFFDTSGFKPYPEYKDSGIEWLGEIPEHWDVKQLRRVIKSLKNGTTAPQLDSGTTNYPVTRIETISNGYINYNNVGYLKENDVDKRYILNKDDILISHINSLEYIGNCAIYKDNETLVHGMNLLRLIPDDNIIPDFLIYYLKSKNFKYSARIHAKPAINQASVSSTVLKSLKFSYPSNFNEQKSIANFLDKETHKIDKLIEKKQRLVELLEEKRSALINHTVAKGLDPDVEMKDSGIEWLGEIPEHWDVVKLKYLLRSKVTDGPHESPAFVDNGIPFLSADSIQNGKLKFENCRYVPYEDHIRYIRKCKPEKYDLLLGKAASVGKVALVDVDFEFSIWSPLALIKPDTRELNSKLLYYVLRSRYVQKQIDMLNHTNTQDNLGMKEIENLKIILPSVSEQKQIADYLDQRTSKIDELINKINHQIEYLKEYRTALISAAVTGKIDVRGEEQK